MLKYLSYCKNFLYQLFFRAESSEQIFKGAELKIHPLFNGKTYDNDIALIKLNRPALLNDKVNVACLPDVNSRVALTCLLYTSDAADE